MGVKKLIGALCFFAASSLAANAVTLDVSSNGQLLSASGVNINGVSYNVSFSEGSCASIYDGCDSNEDFTFKTEAEADLASKALLDQVFINNAQGNFDTNAALTTGCGFVPFCFVYTPYAMHAAGVALGKAALNYGYRSYQDQVFANKKGFLSDDTSVSSGIHFAFAQWSQTSPSSNQTVITTPLPAGMLLLLTGLAGIAVVGSQRTRSRA